ncbi:MAG TPA: helix-turn-helix domain-containing protein [Acidimicrobiia bacterium]|nr:helix-turn-helix domain-containing protein [Acidimicrobiia bacterium]
MVGDLYSPPAPRRRVDRATWDREIKPVVARLETADEQVAQTAIGALRKVLPSYRDVSDEALRASALRNSASARKTLLARRLPGDTELAEAAVAAGERADQGVYVQDVLTAYRLSIHQIREFLTEAATAAGCAPAVTLEMVQLLWALADAVGVRLATVHRDAEIEIARHGERQRAEFLRGLVFGSVAPAEIRRLGPAYHLTPDLRYVALRGRPAPGVSAGDLVRVIGTAVRAGGQHAFVDILEGDVVGVAPKPPEIDGFPGIVGVGPAADLAGIEPSFATASRVLEVAERFGVPGVYRLEDLSLRVAVAAEDELGELLVRRYLRPVEKLGGRAAAVFETVAAFIEHGLSVKATAEALDVHQNTVRYRLGRFEELTGACLERPVCAFEVWWAMQREWLASRGGTSGVDL